MKHDIEESCLINSRYQIYPDGCVYDTKCGKDIPQYIFRFRDFVIKNHKTMESNYE